jgi:hypothetical protein
MSSAVTGPVHPLRSCGSPRFPVRFASGVRRAHWLARFGTVRSAGAMRLPLLGASLTRFTAAGARFSAGRHPSSPAGRVTAKVDRLVRTTLMRFPRVGVPSAFAGRAVPSGVAVSRTIPLRRFSRCRHPTGVRSRPCGFSTPRVFPSFRSYGKRRPAGHSPPDSFSAVYRARAGRSRDLGGSLHCTRRRSWDSPLPFAALLLACGRWRVSRVTGPTCRFRPVRRRECFRSRARDKPSRAVGGRVCGSWAFVPRPSRSLRSTGPAIAFARRADAMHGPLLPWAYRFLSQGFGVAGLGSPLPEPFRRGFSSAGAVVSAATGDVASRRRARGRCAGPRA